MRPPKGYITVTEAKKILHISDAMIRIHVQKGRIKYLLPEGRKQGFYLEKDVKKLADELNIFLSLDEEEEGSEFVKATKEDLKAVQEIGAEIFSPEIDVSSTPQEWRIPLMEKNPDILYVLKRKNQVIGYASTLPFKKDTDKITKVLEAELLTDANIVRDDIEVYERGKHIHLYIGAIAIKPSLKKSERHIYGARLINGLVTFIVELGSKGVVIETVVAEGETRIGIRLLQAFGFIEALPSRSGKRIFLLEIEKSNSPRSLEYKQALQESGVLTETYKTTIQISNKLFQYVIMNDECIRN